jgi:DNA-binding NarL/FixJ family response regulator
MHILIVDDSKVARQVLAASLRIEGFDPVTVARDVTPDAVVVQARELGPALALVDLHLGPEIHGAQLIEPLKELGVQVVVLTGAAPAHERGRCLQLGAVAVLDKGMAFVDLVEALRRVAVGEPAMTNAERAALLEAADRADADERRRSARLEQLTTRERVVLGHLVEGRTAGEIALAEGVKLSTVRSQIQSIFTKVGVNSQQALIAVAHREDLDRRK